MHDTLEVFGGRIPELHELRRQRISSRLGRRDRTAVSKAADVLFGDISDDVRRAAQMADNRRLSAETVREARQYGFSQIFG